MLSKKLSEIPEQSYEKHLDKYTKIAVVDSSKYFTDKEAICINMQQKRISHLNANSVTHMQFDELCSCYE